MRLSVDTILWRVGLTIGGLVALLFLMLLAVAEMRQAKGWEMFPDSRVLAHTQTSWPSTWTGVRTTEGVATNLYLNDDPILWAQKHKALVLQVHDDRPKAED